MKTLSATTVTGTVDTANAQAMTFDADGAAHLMSILSNMYKDKALAVLREYAANARDAHIQAGNPAPIRVTMPTEWQPVLTIADNGTGLSADEIVTVYASYGKSTKRDSNDQVGAFGIGAKSAFTIATQYTVTAVKNGQKNVAVFALNNNGIGTVDIKGTAETDEPNGVTVSVPVDDADAMRQAAHRLFGTWEPGTVLVDGEAPRYVPDTMLQVTDQLYARRIEHNHERTDPHNGLTIVMGGIPYPATAAIIEQAARATENTQMQQAFTALADRRYNRLDLIAFVPVGGVDITPSREDLRDTPRTITALVGILTEYLAQYRAAAERAVSAEPTAMAAKTRASELSAFLPSMNNGITWRGQWLPPKVFLPFPLIDLIVGNGGNNRTRFEDSPELWLHSSLSGTLVITGVDVQAARTVRRLANRFMSHHAVARLLLAPDEKGAVGWLAYGGDSPLPTMPFAEFKEQADTLKPVSTRDQATYHVVVNGSYGDWTHAELRAAAKDGRRLLLAPKQYTDSQVAFHKSAMGPNDVLVVLRGTQMHETFYARFKTAESAEPVIQTYAREILDAATDVERLALEYQQDRQMDAVLALRDLRSLPPLRSLVDTYLARRSAFGVIGKNRHEQLRIALSESGTEQSPADYTTGLPLLDLLLDHLGRGLVRSIEPSVRDHLALYIDAAQAA